MEVHQLHILRELGALGSVSAVARMLDVTPSAVSQQLAALQRGFRTPLTHKDGRILVLTDAGRVLADAGAEVIDAMAAARAAVDEFEQSPSGVVTVSGFHSAGQTLFGPLLRELARRRPAPDVRLSDEDVTRDAYPALTARYDLVVAHRFAEGSPWPGTVRCVTLADEPLDVALAADHPLARHARLRPEQVADQRWVTSRGGYSTDDLLVAVTAVAGRHIEAAHRINDYGTLTAIVAAGDAVGIVPRYTSPPDSSGAIVLRPLDGVSARRSIDVLARPENLRRKSVRTVVAALTAVVARIVRERRPDGAGVADPPS